MFNGIKIEHERKNIKEYIKIIFFLFCFSSIYMMLTI